MSATLASPFKQTRPPAWADGWGQDEFGYYAEFGINTGPNYWDFVTQRMRWVPPGTFMMGSPADEPDRDDNELLHEVTITSGYWLADTACRQELWQAVMGNNPSHFQGDAITVDETPGDEMQSEATRPNSVHAEKLPVEQVSYEDTETFFQKVSQLKPQLKLQLPTEAQWEYACRAGTTSPFSFGRNITTTQANYDGNYPYDGAEKREYRRSTIACDALPPNPWGLFQMHGNVWEWCSDWYGDFSSDTNDPAGPDSGSDRVIRGGSWYGNAPGLRSACRYGFEPGFRYDFLGFRCVSSVQ